MPQRLENLQQALDRSLRRVRGGRPLRFLVDAPGARESRTGLRFTPLPRRLDRVRITNWNSEPTRVHIAEAHLELAPGESAALWMDGGDPDPVAAEPDGPQAPAFILPADQERFAFG